MIRNLARTPRVAVAVLLLAVVPAAVFGFPWGWEHSALVVAVVGWYTIAGGIVARGFLWSAAIDVDAATRTLRVATRPWFRSTPAEVVPFADLLRVFADVDRVVQAGDGGLPDDYHWLEIPKICVTRRSAAPIELSLHSAYRAAEADAIVWQILEALRVAQNSLDDPRDEAPFRGRQRDLGA